MREKYFPTEVMTDARWGVYWEMRADLAWDLIHHFGSIAATANGEDSTGRTKFVLQEAHDLVARCFAIADNFVLTAEARGDFKATSITLEEKAESRGKLAAIQTNAEWRRDASPAKK